MTFAPAPGRTDGFGPGARWHFLDRDFTPGPSFDPTNLVYYQEKAIVEVAEIIGIPENTVKTRMFYARKRLAELLKGAGLDQA